MLDVYTVLHLKYERQIASELDKFHAVFGEPVKSCKTTLAHSISASGAQGALMKWDWIVQFARVELANFMNLLTSKGECELHPLQQKCTHGYISVEKSPFLGRFQKAFQFPVVYSNLLEWVQFLLRTAYVCSADSVH